MNDILKNIGILAGKISRFEGYCLLSNELEIISVDSETLFLSGYDFNEIKNEKISFLIPLITEKHPIENSHTGASEIYIKSKSHNRIPIIINSYQSVGENNLLLIKYQFPELINEANKIKQDSEKTLEEKSILEVIFNNNIEGTFTINNDWVITSFNSSAEKITGYSKEEAIGKNCWEIFKSDLCQNGCHMEKTMKSKLSTSGNELKIVKKSGNAAEIRVNSTVLKNEDNEIIGAVETFVDITELKNLSDHLHKKYGFQNIIGKSREMEKVFSLLESVCETDSTVLITGESGTGKELIARAIHLNSARKKGPFVAVNCASFAESLIESELFGHEKGAFTGAIKERRGKFEIADGGTLFLDEIAEISTKTQVMLLRVIETKEFERVGGNKLIPINARIIAATNKDLEKEIEEGRFRRDLFHRLNIVHIHLPPLRERKSDLNLLIDLFIEHFNGIFNKSIKGFSPRAYQKMQCYDYPGNIRELENIIESAFVVCKDEIIDVQHLPRRVIEYKNHILVRNYSIKKGNISELERKMILDALERNNGNRKATAADLDIDTSTLWRKMKKYDIKF